MRYLQLSVQKSLLIVGLALVGWQCVATWLNVTYAFPSDLEIAFAKASKRVETGSAAARCLIVWLTNDLSSKNVYCTYRYPRRGQFCDKPNGIKFDNIRLEYALNLTDNLSQWFSNKYPWHYHKITGEERTQILKFLSNETAELIPSRGSWNDNPPHTVHLLDHDMPDELGLYDVRYQNVPQKIFAFLVHYSIPNKLQEISTNTVHKTDITPTTTSTTTTHITPVTTDTKPNNSNIHNDGITLPKSYLIILGIGISIIILILAGFFLRKRSRYGRKIHQHLAVEYPNNYPWLDSEDSTKTQHDLGQQTRKSFENSLKYKLKAEQYKNKEITTILKNTEAERNKLSKQYENELAQHQQAQKRIRKANEQINALRQAKQTLQTVLYERFRFLKPDNLKFSHWTKALIEQPGVWRWLQSELSIELLVCEPIVNHIQHNGSKKEQQILELLHIDNLMTHWGILVNQFFESNDKLWAYLQDIDGGNWMNQLLRADDVLQTYFPEEESLKLLSQHLSTVSGILQAAFVEMGVTLISPQILEKIPSDLSENQRCEHTPDTLLKALVKPQIQKRFPEVSEFVVDVEKYGFVTATNPDAAADVRVFVSSPAEWEESGSPQD